MNFHSGIYQEKFNYKHYPPTEQSSIPMYIYSALMSILEST